MSDTAWQFIQELTRNSSYNILVRDLAVLWLQKNFGKVMAKKDTKEIPFVSFNYH
jgi:hypothetical protein